MPANTPSGLPYPLPTEPIAEGAQRIRELAEALDPAPRRIAVVSLAAVAPTIDFPAIPQQFSHLRLIVHARSDVGATDTGQRIRINNRADATYDWALMQSIAGAAPTAGANTADTFIPFGEAAGGTDAGGAFSVSEALFSRYAVNGIQKAVHTRCAHASSARKLIQEAAATHRGLDPITRLTVLLSTGNFAAGSHAALYGLP